MRLIFSCIHVQGPIGLFGVLDYPPFKENRFRLDGLLAMSLFPNSDHKACVDVWEGQYDIEHQ